MIAYKEKVSPERPRRVAEVAPSHMFGVGGPLYDPPYETPLEDELAWHLVKYLHRSVRLRSQVRVPTPCGVFWVDFVIEHRGRRIALECGALDEDVDERQERFRDALIMGSAVFQTLYRFRGKDLFYHMEDVLFLLSRLHPELFTERGRINLERLASFEARVWAPPRRGPVLTLAYDAATDAAATDAVAADEAYAPVRIKRLRLKCATDWVRDHDAALAEYGASAPLAKSA